VQFTLPVPPAPPELCLHTAVLFPSQRGAPHGAGRRKRLGARAVLGEVPAVRRCPGPRRGRLGKADRRDQVELVAVHPGEVAKRLAGGVLRDDARNVSRVPRDAVSRKLGRSAGGRAADLWRVRRLDTTDVEGKLAVLDRPVRRRLSKLVCRQTEEGDRHRREIHHFVC